MAEEKKKDEAAAPVTDPLEAVKISSKPAPKPKAAPKPFVPDAKAKEQLEAARAAQAAPAEAETNPEGRKRYRVVSTTHVSLEGQITRLNAGDIVSESSYGPRGMAQIRGANVPLVEVVE